ncbi:hypothetical protein [Candidatus Palauibacter sp.]|uniref:hypothetical protein n=1 Tax=Candidatus Palauibacter sp. TaxID=3101350 RepID=UPI003CC6488C
MDKNVAKALVRPAAERGFEALAAVIDRLNVARVTMRTFAIGTVVGSLLVATGCSTEETVAPVPPTPPPPPEPAAIVISADTVRLPFPGAVDTLGAVVLDQYGKEMTDAAVSWRSLSLDIVVVSSAGVATAVGHGQTTIVARAGEVADSAAAISFDPPMPFSIEIERDTLRHGRGGRTKRCVKREATYLSADRLPAIRGETRRKDVASWATIHGSGSRGQRGRRWRRGCGSRCAA